MTIPVFYTISDDFTPYAAVSLNSLVKNTTANHDYTITFISRQLSTAHQEALLAYEQENIHIHYFKINDDLVAAIQNRKENFLRGEFFTLSIFYRLFIPDLFAQYDKAIYIDSDTILNADIAKLYEIDLGQNFFAACPDLSIRDVPKLQRYLTDALALAPKQYINSGVLLMNSKRFRDEKFSSHFLSLLTRHHFDCIAPDQDYLNEICANQIQALPAKWDAMPNAHMAAIENPSLVHYNLFFKPWHYAGIQYEALFWQSAQETPFYAQLRNELTHFTAQDRLKQRQKLTQMLGRVDEILAEPHNWARVKASGEKVQL